MILPQEFVDYGNLAFYNRLRFMYYYSSWTFWTLCFNTEWATCIGIRQLTFIIHHLNHWRIAVQGKVWFVIRGYSVCKVHVHLKNWTLKFKLLYLLNRTSYFNKSCMIRSVNTHIQILKVCLKSMLPLLKTKLFLVGCSYWCTLYYMHRYYGAL